MLRDEAECGKPAQAESKQGEDRNEEKCSGNTFGVSDDAEPAADGSRLLLGYFIIFLQNLPVGDERVACFFVPHPL